MYRAYFIDDEPLVLEELISNVLFAECGYQVIGFSTDTVTAEKEIKKHNPDVVFTDLRMPKCTGIELIEKLKESGAVCEFVIISAFEEFDALRRFLDAGGFGYLTKPVADHDLRKLLTRLAGKIAGKMPQTVETFSPELNRVSEYLKANLTEKHTLESVSDALHIHAKHISRLFATNLGTTFVAYLTKLRMEEAARLLRTTAKDIQEISDLCGFSDSFYFCRVFREHYACTPKVFREAVCR